MRLVSKTEEVEPYSGARERGGGGASPGVVVGHLCLWFVGTRLEFVEVGQLFPVVVLVLVRVVMVGAHDVLGHAGVRLLWPRHPEEPDRKDRKSGFTARPCCRDEKQLYPQLLLTDRTSPGPGCSENWLWG